MGAEYAEINQQTELKQSVKLNSEMKQRSEHRLRRRLDFIPLVDLADCVNVSHRAIGSPHFNNRGEPISFDPLITVMVGDLLDAYLPHTTAIISPSSTRPLFTTDPRTRR